MSGCVAHRRREREPVVITGTAAVSPLGCDPDGILDSLFAGVSGVRQVDVDKRVQTPAPFAAPVTVIAPPAGVTAGEFAALNRLEQMCLTPLVGALADSGIDQSLGGPRIGLVLGLGAEQLKAWELDFLAGGRTVFEAQRTPTLVHRLAARAGITGPALTVAAACTRAAMPWPWRGAGSTPAGSMSASPAAATSSAPPRSPPSITSGPSPAGPMTRPRRRGPSTGPATAL